MTNRNRESKSSRMYSTRTYTYRPPFTCLLYSDRLSQPFHPTSHGLNAGSTQCFLPSFPIVEYPLNPSQFPYLNPIDRSPRKRYFRNRATERPGDVVLSQLVPESSHTNRWLGGFENKGLWFYLAASDKYRARKQHALPKYI